jgi:hypothetical protein
MRVSVIMKEGGVDHSETFNKEQVLVMDNIIAATADSGLSALYGAGTDKCVGWKPPHLKRDKRY